MTTSPSPLRRFAGNYLILLGGLVAILGAAGQWVGLTNAIAASLGALLVAAGSFAGYRKLVQNAPLPSDEADRDPLDRIDDPHELYDEPTQTPERSTDEVIAEEKARLKAAKIPLGERFRLMGGAFSPLRLVGYLSLVVAFFALEGYGLFAPLFFIGGLLVLPLAAMMLIWQNRH